MKKNFLISFTIMILVFLTANFTVVNAQSVNSNSIGETNITLYLDGVDDNFNLVQEKKYLDNGYAWFYEDDYMGNLIIGKYGDNYEGWIYSIFGEYKLQINSLGIIMNIIRYNNDGEVINPGTGFENQYSQEDLDIVSLKKEINETMINMNYLENVGDDITFEPMYTQSFLDKKNWTIDDLYSHLICQAAITQQLLINDGFINEVILLQPVKVDYNDQVYSYEQFEEQMFDKSVEVEEIINLIEINKADYTYMYFDLLKFNSQATTLLGHAWDSSNSVGIEKPDFNHGYFMAHEFTHTLGIGHNNGNFHFADYRPAEGVAYAETYNQNFVTVGDIMASAYSKILYFSSRDLLKPTAAKYIKYSFGDYFEADSLEYLHSSVLGQESRLEEVAMYGETYAKYPQIDFSTVDGYTLLRYYADSNTDIGYSDLQWNEEVIIDIDEGLTTYKPGGTGDKYSTLVLNVTNNLGNTKKYYRDIENISGSYDELYEPLDAYTIGNFTLIDDKYIQRFNVEIDSNSKQPILVQMKQKTNYFEAYELVCMNNDGEVLNMQELNLLAIGERLECEARVQQDDYYNGLNLEESIKYEYQKNRGYSKDILFS